MLDFFLYHKLDCVVWRERGYMFGQVCATRCRLILTGYALFLQAMANTQKDIDNAQIALLMTAIHRHNEECRAEYGDLPTQDIHINGTVGTYPLPANDLAKARRAAENFEQSLLSNDKPVNRENDGRST